jgi:hypothetical protein
MTLSIAGCGSSPVDDPAALDDRVDAVRSEVVGDIAPVRRVE